MALHNELGKRGEEMAAQLLQRIGYAILERNWRYGNLEIDIIARSEKEIIFVEVKTRSDDSLMRPEEAVKWQKMRYMTIAAGHYIQYKRINLEPRFDIVAIVLNSQRCDIQHFESAFPPVGRRRYY